MSADIVQADNQALESVANQFGQRAEAAAEMQHSLLHAVDQLRDGGWIGASADAFFAEMDELVLPAVQRLVDALEQAGQTTQQISELMSNADDEASAGFREDAASGAGAGGATESGGGSSGGGSPGSGSGGGEPPTAAPSDSAEAPESDEAPRRSQFRDAGPSPAGSGGGSGASSSSGGAASGMAADAPAEGETGGSGGVGIAAGLAAASPFFTLAGKAVKDKVDKRREK
jgi:WXG100 family type VII secretion target